VGVKVAAGWKAHSGWAALVVVGFDGKAWHLLERGRVALVAPGTEAWAKQPFHAAEGLESEAAQAQVQRAVEAARRITEGEVRGLMARLDARGHRLAGGAVLVGAPLPAWSLEQILAVHVRMHQAEGALFPAALAHGLEACGLPAARVPEKGLQPPVEPLARLGRTAGPPWGADQKKAAWAAITAFGP
jgi:hypothetical protein